MMKAAFTPVLLAFCCLSAPAVAQTGHADWLACDKAVASGQASDDCAALHAAYIDRVSACMTQRKALADRTAGSTLANGSHTSRARHLLCEAEVMDGLGIASR
jgi:hypothetical protein